VALILSYSIAEESSEEKTEKMDTSPASEEKKGTYEHK